MSVNLNLTQEEIIANRVRNALNHLRLYEMEERSCADMDLRSLVDETIDIWVPWAERLGMRDEQVELQNLALRLGYPDDYNRLKNRLQRHEASYETIFATFAAPIKAMLDKLGMEYTFTFRMKSVYSIWRKMTLDNKKLEDVYDLFAARIVFRPKDTIVPANRGKVHLLPVAAAVEEQTLGDLDVEEFYCWRIYTIIASLYPIHPDRIKDWVMKPKPSGYQALHLTVQGPENVWIEMQIRSERMHYEAEYGSATHWKYKMNMDKE